MAESIPHTKQQMINIMKQQLQTMQSQIQQVKDALQLEKKSRKSLLEDIDEKEGKIKQVIEEQSLRLGDKVQEGLYKTLKIANQMRADAQAKCRDYALQNSSLNEIITQKDSFVLENKDKIVLNAKKIGALDQKILDAKRKSQNLTDRKNYAEKDLALMKQQLERVEREEKQLRTHIQNMKSLRLFLNKHFDNPVVRVKQSKPVLKPSKNEDNFWNS